LLDKGRMRPILERLAVDVVLASDVGLRGARRAALKLGALRG
jgi:glucokinase